MVAWRVRPSASMRASNSKESDMNRWRKDIRVKVGILDVAGQPGNVS